MNRLKLDMSYLYKCIHEISIIEENVLVKTAETEMVQITSANTAHYNRMVRMKIMSRL